MRNFDAEDQSEKPTDTELAKRSSTGSQSRPGKAAAARQARLPWRRVPRAPGAPQATRRLARRAAALPLHRSCASLDAGTDLHKPTRHHCGCRSVDGWQVVHACHQPWHGCRCCGCFGVAARIRTSTTGNRISKPACLLGLTRRLNTSLAPGERRTNGRCLLRAPGLACRPADEASASSPLADGFAASVFRGATGLHGGPLSYCVHHLDPRKRHCLGPAVRADRAPCTCVRSGVSGRGQRSGSGVDRSQGRVVLTLGPIGCWIHPLWTGSIVRTERHQRTCARAAAVAVAGMRRLAASPRRERRRRNHTSPGPWRACHRTPETASCCPAPRRSRLGHTVGIVTNSSGCLTRGRAAALPPGHESISGLKGVD